MNQEYQDRIDDYLLNRMTMAERQIFEQEVKADEELRKQLEFSRKVQASFKDRGDKLAKMTRWEQEVTNQSRDVHGERRLDTTPVQTWIKYLYWSSGIAAVFIIGFFLLNTMSNSGNIPVEGPGDSLSKTETADGALNQGNETDSLGIKEMLAKGDYHSALALIENEEIRVRAELDSFSSDDQGINNDSLEDGTNSSMHSAESYNDETRIFSSSAVDVDMEDEMEILESELNELEWLKAQALIGCNEEERALIILDNLRLKKGPYQLQADLLYQELKKKN